MEFPVLFGPEAAGEEDEDGEEFETTYEHQQREDPFAGRGYDFETFAVACDAGAESGVADA